MLNPIQFGKAFCICAALLPKWFSGISTDSSDVCFVLFPFQKIMNRQNLLFPSVTETINWLRNVSEPQTSFLFPTLLSWHSCDESPQTQKHSRNSNVGNIGDRKDRPKTGDMNRHAFCVALCPLFSHSWQVRSQDKQVEPPNCFTWWPKNDTQTTNTEFNGTCLEMKTP